MKIISWNIRSLVKHFDEISLLFNNSNIDIVNFNETWLGMDNLNCNFRLHNYKIYRLDRAGKRRGGGLCTYVKGNLHCNAATYQSLNVSCMHLEAMLLEITLPQTKPIIMINLYRPPSGKVSEGIEISQNILNQLPDNVELYLTDDLNIDISQKNSQSYKAIKGLEHANGLKQLINKSTRITSKSDTVIDHFYINSEIVNSSGVLDINVSDHLPIYAIRKKTKKDTKLVTFTCRKLKYFCNDFYKEKLLSLNWEDLYNSNDPNKVWEILVNSIRTILDKYYPFKTYKNVPTKANWITNEIFEIMKQRDNLYKRAKILNSEDLWLEAKRLRNLTASMCKKAKTEFISNNLTNNQSNPKKFWSDIGNIWNKKEDNSVSETNLYDPADGVLRSGPYVGEIFNTYFSSVGEKLYKNIAWLTQAELLSLDKNMNFSAENRPIPEFKFRPITLIGLERLINKIEIHKNSGIDGISSQLLKMSFKILLPQVLHMFNSSIMSGIFPDAWKTAKVTPLFKSGNSRDPQNYRPIVCLPLPGKTLGKISTWPILQLLGRK